MVDEKLLNEIREMREKGASQPSDVLKLFEVAKQLSTESEDMKEEIEDMDTVAVQLVMNDIDFKWYVKMGGVNYIIKWERDGHMFIILKRKKEISLD